MQGWKKDDGKVEKVMGFEKSELPTQVSFHQSLTLLLFLLYNQLKEDLALSLT